MKLDPGKWPIVRAIYEQALDVATAARPDFLHQACSGDLDLIAAVQEFLKTDAVASGFLEQPAFKIQECTLARGQKVSDCEIEKEIARGGMSIVYLAKDLALDRQVAVKVMQYVGLPADAFRRFKREAKVLAKLRHPAIATLHTSGVTPEGFRYLVMEYVEGEFIDQFSEKSNLTPLDRIRLFARVCEAVHFAHHHGVIHRDIKPSNILVSRGEPKLLDFGVATLIDNSSRRPLEETGPMPPPLTLRYASPEQVTGELVSTVSDVYSLGVVLYELLTSTSPYQLQEGGASTLVEAILSQEPRPPSRVLKAKAKIAGRRLRRAFLDDLDAVALKALRKEPAERYPSARALHRDIENLLSDRPVEARQTPKLDRARKYVRRNWRWLFPLGSAALITFASLLTLVGQYREALLQRDAAERAKNQARQMEQTSERVSDLLIEVFNSSDPAERRGGTFETRSLLEAGARRADSELKNEPAIRARLLGAIGVIYTNLGVYPEAEKLLTSSLAQRRLLRRPVDTRRALLDLAHLRLAQNRLLEAEGLTREAFGLSHVVSPPPSADVAECEDFLGWILLMEGKVQDSERFLRSALAVRRKLFGELHRDVALSTHNLAVLLQNSGRSAEALPLLEATLRIQRHLFGENHPDVAMTLNNLASNLASANRSEEAEPFLRESLAIFRKVDGDQHRNVGMVLQNLSLVVLRRGDLEEAEELMKQAVEIARRNFGGSGLSTAGALQGMAVVLEAKGEYLQCATAATQSLAIVREDLPPDSYGLALVEDVLGGCLIGLGRLGEADRLLRHSHPIIVAARGEGSPPAMDSTRRLEDLAKSRGLRTTL